MCVSYSGNPRSDIQRSIPSFKRQTDFVCGLEVVVKCQKSLGHIGCSLGLRALWLRPIVWIPFERNIQNHHIWSSLLITWYCCQLIYTHNENFMNDFFLYENLMIILAFIISKNKYCWRPNQSILQLFNFIFVQHLNSYMFKQAANILKYGIWKYWHWKICCKLQQMKIV